MNPWTIQSTVSFAPIDNPLFIYGDIESNWSGIPSVDNMYPRLKCNNNTMTSRLYAPNYTIDLWCQTTTATLSLILFTDVGVKILVEWGNALVLELNQPQFLVINENEL